MRARELGKRFVAGWGLPAAAFLFWCIAYWPTADAEVRNGGYPDQRFGARTPEPVEAPGTSALLVVATVILIVAVGQRLYRSLRAAR